MASDKRSSSAAVGSRPARMASIPAECSLLRWLKTERGGRFVVTALSSSGTLSSESKFKKIHQPKLSSLLSLCLLIKIRWQRVLGNSLQPRRRNA